MRKLSIVIPCLNEAETIEKCIMKAKHSIEKLHIDGEILVADNGSTDNSVEIAEKLGARVVHVEGKGYGNALQGGIESAEGRWIIMADADDSYDLGDIAPFLGKLREGYELVIGCRLPGGGGKIKAGAMPWMHRWVGNPVLSWIGRLLFKSPVTDFHCGMRAFTKEAYRKLGLKTTGMEFASEMIIKASIYRIRIAEIPITLYKDGRSRPPHLRSWRDGWRHLRFMLLYSPTWLFLFPGVTMVLAGTGFGFRLWEGPWKVGVFGFDTNTMLICSMSVVTGLQIILFGIFTRVFAITEGLIEAPWTYNKFSSFFSLEKGIIIGVIILIFGIYMLTKAILYWEGAQFGAISYPDSLRKVIPAVTLITVGIQIIFSSFFLSILDLPRK